MLHEITEPEAEILVELIDYELEVLEAVQEEEVCDPDMPLDILLSSAADRYDRKQHLQSMRRRFAT